MLEFLGRTHLLLLHLPIGILLLGFVFEWSVHFRWVKIHRNALTLVYFIGAIAAIFACISGWILSDGYNYTNEETNNHFWAGIVTAVIATLICIVHIRSEHPSKKWLALALAISVAVTGHLGGSLTHGEGFLNPVAISEEKSSFPVFKVEDVERAEAFEDIIFPIIDAKCVSCHGANKIKGKLRMDTPELIIAGGKSGEDLLGQNGEIEMRISLPESNDKHMPPKNKTQLTEDEHQVISWWLQNGSNFDLSVGDLGASPDLIKQIEGMIESASDQSDVANISAFLPDEDPGEIDQKTLVKIKSDNIVALPAGKKSNFLELNFVNIESLTPEVFNGILPISNHITRLQLSDQAITDEMMEEIGQMKNLVKLYLDNTSITNQGLSYLSELKYLTYLNINGTDVNNKGVEFLSRLPNLENIYAYKTAVTVDSIINGKQVIKGDFNLQILESDTTRL